MGYGFECCTEIIRNECVKYNIECIEAVKKSQEYFLIMFLGLPVTIIGIIAFIFVVTELLRPREKK